MALMYSARSAWTLGENAQARAYADEGVRLATELGHPHTLAFAWYFDSQLQVLFGDAPAVIDRSARAIGFCTKHGLAAYRSWFRLLEAWANCQHDNPEQGVTEMAALIAVDQVSTAHISTPFFLSLHAECEAVRGNVVRALSLVEEALAGIKEDRLWESHLCRQRGELLAALGAEHHLPAAVESLRKAIAIAERQGGVAFARRAAAALAILRPVESPVPRAGALSTLSARERELLGLVRRGMTDKEIAATLAISLATVRAHLVRVLDKTGLQRRAELSRLADDFGLSGDEA